LLTHFVFVRFVSYVTGFIYKKSIDILSLCERFSIAGLPKFAIQKKRRAQAGSQTCANSLEATR